MKKLLFAIAVLFISTVASAQKLTTDNVPADVLSAFKNKFSTATKTTWELDYDSYEASFSFLNTPMSALFDKDGNWLESHYYIKYQELPKEVKDSLSKQFGTVLGMYKTDDLEKVEMKDKDITYKMTVTKDSKMYDMVFSEKGQIIKKALSTDGDMINQKKEKNK